MAKHGAKRGEPYTKHIKKDLVFSNKDEAFFVDFKITLTDIVKATTKRRGNKHKLGIDSLS